MKKIALLFSFVILVFASYYSMRGRMPRYQEDAGAPDTVFSVDRALSHLKVISSRPHYCGTKSHGEVREYLVRELQKMGLKPIVQKQEVFYKKWKAGATVFNIISRIKGKKNGKALLLLSHYDSTPHSSFGASDDGSGIVTLLEGIRAFLASGTIPEHDIIILFSDAEELGLLGAKAFVQYHPWAKDVGLVVNFEARGSGGLSYMLLETNGGNKRLIETFHQAQTPYPVSNSLLYSIYKMLPNDTDLTVFRENAGIDGINFAFIDDFYDYHTAQDTYERLDRATLAHNASYIMPVLKYYSSMDLTTLHSDTDEVFFDFPGFGLVYYPFDYVFPSALVLLILFITGLAVAVRRKSITPGEWFRAWIPFLLSLTAAVVTGVYGWKLMQWIFPEYKDILHGFPYQGKVLIVFFFSLLFYFNFKIISRKKLNPLALQSVSVFFWIVLILIISWKLKGAGFFILAPLSAFIYWLYEVYAGDKNYPVLFATLLIIPVLMVFVPILIMFPVGLGLKAVFISLFFGSLLFTSFSAYFKRYPSITGTLFLLTAAVSFISLWITRSYTPDRKKPTGVFYLYDSVSGNAYFASYNRSDDSYISPFFDAGKQDTIPVDFYNKFKNNVRYAARTGVVNLPLPEISLRKDTTGGALHKILTIRSKRDADMFYLRCRQPDSSMVFSCNGKRYQPDFSDKKNTVKRQNKVNFLSYWLTADTDSLQIEYDVRKNDKPLDWELYEVKYDLLTNPGFDIRPRSAWQMPIPFVINDATVIRMEL